MPNRLDERPKIGWELDSHHTLVLFRLARERAEKQIQKYRMRLIEFQRFDPQPEKYEMATGTFVQFDHNTKQDRINTLNRWLSTYEQIARFCLKVEAVVACLEAEQFGEQIAQVFGKRK